MLDEYIHERRRAILCLGPRYFNALVLLGLSGDALAHDEVGGGAGFLAGLFHPALGFDHLLAMLSVGILSAQIGGRAIWHIPATFVLAMIIGAIVGMQGIQLLLVEVGIALSVLILGVTLAAERRLPEWAAILAVSVFGFFHGHAHGTEMPIIANAWLYGIGFVLGTSIIHLTGVFACFGFLKFESGGHVIRAAGLGIAGIGAYFLISI